MNAQADLKQTNNEELACSYTRKCFEWG